MALIDSRGRVFGRMNVVDLLVGVAIVIAIPVGYAAYALWRTPAPQLTQVLPATQIQGPNLQVEIHGERLRPYMRLSFGDHQGLAFYFVSPTVAVVPMPPMTPGVYDVILYDYSREVARLPKALTVQPPLLQRSVTMAASGAFVEIAESMVALITPGLALGPNGAGAVRSVAAAVPAIARIESAPGTTITLPVSHGIELPATIDLTCRLDVTADGNQRCLIGDSVVTTGAIITLPVFSGLRFRVDELRAPAAKR
jgi:hypothetical protein